MSLFDVLRRKCTIGTYNVQIKTLPSYVFYSKLKLQLKIK